MLSDEYDLVVIGAAVVGLSAACVFAKSKPNSKILILEKGAEQNYRDEVGSQGNLRGSRSVMQNDMLYEFITKNWEFMHELEAQFPRKILTPTTKEEPYLMLVERPMNAINITQTLRHRGVDYQYLSIGDANEKYNLNLSMSYAGVVNAMDSKRINLGNYILSMREFLQQQGAEISYSNSVQEFSNPTRLRLTSGQQISTKEICICAGEQTSEVLQAALGGKELPERLQPSNVKKVPQRTLHVKLPDGIKPISLYNLDIGTSGALGFYMFGEEVNGELLQKIGYDPTRNTTLSEKCLNEQEDHMLCYLAQIYRVGVADLLVRERHNCYYMIDPKHEICAGKIAGSNIYVGSNFIGYGVMAGYGAFASALSEPEKYPDISPDSTFTWRQKREFDDLYNHGREFPIRKNNPTFYGQLASGR